MATGTWDLLAPEVSKNLVQNPTFGTLASGWGTVNGTLTADTTAANILFGSQCGHYSGTTLPANSGAYANVDTAASATTYVSVWIKGSAPAKLGVYVGGAWTYKTSLTTLETLANGYIRYGASFTAGEANGATYAGVFWAGTTDAYIGGFQCEQSSTYTTQIYGDAGPGYVWNGAAHQSSSTRYILDPDGKVVYGGSITALDDRANVVCEAQVGVGLLPYAVESLSLAGETPALFVKHDLHARDIQLSLTFNAATSLATSHTRRAALLALFPYGREVWLRYNSANSVLQIRAAVSGQFDLKFDDNEPFGKRTVVAFQALDPKFSLVYADTTALTFSSSPSSSYARMRTDANGWAAMSSGLFAVPRRAITGPDGTVYIGTLASGGSAKLQKWTGSAWADVQSFTGSITGGPILYDLVPNADWTVLYVIGDYTTVGGVAGFGGVAAITLSSGAAAKLGAGVSAGGVPLCGSYITSLSRLYVGGLFTTMNSVSDTGYFCYWNGSTWVSVGTTRPTAGVYCMLNDGNDNLILGGNFTDAWSLSASASVTATAAAGGPLTTTGDYYVWVVPCDGTNYDFTQAYGALTVGGAMSLPLPPHAVFTVTNANRQALVSWSAAPGAQFYAVKVARLYSYATIATDTAAFIDTFPSDTTASYTATNGTITYDGTLVNGLYTKGSLKYTGTSLPADSGVSRSFGTNSTGLNLVCTFSVWVKGATPDKITYGSTVSTSPTAVATYGAWSKYSVTSTINNGSTFSTKITFSGTTTAYISGWKCVANVAYGDSQLKYLNAGTYILPATMTSFYTGAGLSLTSPDAPSADWDVVALDSFTFWTGATGDFGARIVKHKTADASWERMAQPGGGFNGIVRSLAWCGSYLVAAGDFTSVDNAVANCVAYTRGKAWLPLGVSGMSSGSVHRVSYANGTLWAAGSFASADSDTSAALVARMDGFPTGRWTHADLALTNSSNNVYDVVAGPYSLALFDDTTFSSAAGGTSIAYSGTGNLYPRIVVTGPGLLRWLENGLTKARIVLNYTLQAGEVLVIDCDKATVVSDIYGDVTGQLAPSSNLDGFYLAASSTQTVWCHMTGTTAASSVVIQGNRALITGDV